MKKVVKTLLEKDLLWSTNLRKLDNNKIKHAILGFFAHSGDSWYLLALLFFIWLFSRSAWHTYAAFLAAAILIQATLVLGIKFLIKRSRPSGDWGAIYRNSDPHSFPSGHATRVAMLAVLCWGLNLTGLAVILTIWVFLVSFARVILGVHYISDIVVGWLLGIGLAYMMLLLQPTLYALFPWIFF